MASGFDRWSFSFWFSFKIVSLFILGGMTCICAVAIYVQDGGFLPMIITEKPKIRGQML